MSEETRSHLKPMGIKAGIIHAQNLFHGCSPLRTILSFLQAPTYSSTGFLTLI